jgi:hypothetical protein
MAAATIFLHKGQSSSNIYSVDYFFTVLTKPFPKHQFLAVRVWFIDILMANAEMAVSTRCSRSRINQADVQRLT